MRWNTFFNWRSSVRGRQTVGQLRRMNRRQVPPPAERLDEGAQRLVRAGLDRRLRRIEKGGASQAQVRRAQQIGDLMDKLEAASERRRPKTSAELRRRLAATRRP